MPNQFRPHMPGFVDFEPEPAVEFETLGDLMAVPWVARFAAQPGFLQFTVSPGGMYLLVAEYVDGMTLIVGYLDEPVDLPRWTARRQDEHPDGR